MTDIEARAHAYTLPRATPTKTLLAHIAETFGVSTDEARDLGGWMNLNLEVGTRDSRCVARIYMPYVSPERLNDIQRVRDHLRSAGIPTPTARPTLDGRPWSEFEGRLIEVDPFVERDEDMDTWQRLEDGLPTLGRLHSVVERINVGAGGSYTPVANHVEAADALAWSRRGTDRIREWQGAIQAELSFADGADSLAEKLRAAETGVASRLHRQLVHGDYWDNNVFFRRGELVLVADFDFMAERTRVDDVALTLFYTNSSFREDTTSDERLKMLRRLLDAYDRGLDRPLSPIERSAVPLAMARTVLAFVGMIGSIPRRVGEEMAAFRTEDVAWSTDVVDHLDRWQDAFC